MNNNENLGFTVRSAKDLKPILTILNASQKNKRNWL